MELSEYKYKSMMTPSNDPRPRRVYGACLPCLCWRVCGAVALDLAVALATALAVAVDCLGRTVVYCSILHYTV